MDSNSTDLSSLAGILRPLDPSLVPPHSFDGDDPSWAVAVTDRRQPLANAAAMLAASSEPATPGSFFPAIPRTLRDTGLRESQIESLVLKFLLNCSVASGRDVAEQTGLPYGLVEKLLHTMRMEQLLAIKAEAPLGDYAYELTPFGAERGRRYAEQCTYFGTAPVPVEQYSDGVQAQATRKQTLTPSRVREALRDLVLNDEVATRLGEALNLGHGMFLFGSPGNGKSSIAERVVKVYSPTVWLPRAISVGGEIIRLYDPIHHRQVTAGEADYQADRPHDHRWVQIHRPTIMVGGELELASFDISRNRVTGISEAPLQLKGNCGTLVIDDFGRNRFRPEELLNRLVVPLEKRSESLQLSSGRIFRVPFDCMVIFSSNLDPVSLVDEAFLRRIPFRIDVSDPSDLEYKEVFRRSATELHLTWQEADLDDLLQRHYHQLGRPPRFCHPRDLLRLIRNAAEFHGREPVVTRQALDAAVAAHVALGSWKSANSARG